jgi:hypothetical protein
MGLLGWVLMGLAIWHYTIFLPDRFWGGIVGAFLGSIFGAVIVGFLLFLIKSGGLSIPGTHATDILVVCYAVPGAILGIAATYVVGVRQEQQRGV